MHCTRQRKPARTVSSARSERGQKPENHSMKHHRNNALPDIDAALLHHRAGRLQEAEAIYKKMPHDPDAVHLRGVIAHQLARHDEAVELIAKAIQANPSNA